MILSFNIICYGTIRRLLVDVEGIINNIEYKELCSSADPWGVPAFNCY